MKPIHIGLLVAAAALGGAFFMKVVSGPEPAPAPPAVTASVPAQPAVPSEAAPLEQVPPEPKPAPFVEEQPVRKPERRSRPVQTARNRTPERRPESTPPPAPVAQPAPPIAQTPAPVVTHTPPPPAPEPEQESRILKPVEPPAPPPPRTVTLNAGTLVPVRVVETLISDRMSEGDTFNATLDAPLTVDGLVIAERGAKAQGRIARLQQAGRVKGVSSMVLELTSVRTSDGQTVRLQTDTFEREGEKELKKDAAKVGVAAGIGAAIGAIAGGGRGAGIGAAVGGAAGAGGVMATRGKPVTIESETKISFRLSSPVTITEKK